MAANTRRTRRTHQGFTLVEALVTVVLVAVALVGVLGGIRSLGAADVKAREADLLQQLAYQKMAEMGSVSDPSTAESSGDFTDQGYPSDITWTLEDEPSGITDVDQVTITVTRNNASQKLVKMIFIRPTTTTAGAPTQ